MQLASGIILLKRVEKKTDLRSSVDDFSRAAATRVLIKRMTSSAGRFTEPGTSVNAADGR